MTMGVAGKGLPGMPSTLCHYRLDVQGEIRVHGCRGPDDLRLLGLELPDALAIEALDLAQLSVDWRSLPAPECTQSIGSNQAFGFNSRLG